MRKLALDTPNALCGALFVLAGLFFAAESLGMELGTAFRMGPGYFPLLLAGLLVILGLVIVVQALRIEGEPIGAIAWRGMLFILVAPVFFGLTVRGLGFVPSIFLTALIASFASSRMTVPLALGVSVVLAVFATLVFSYALGLPFQRFGPWLPF